MSLFIIFFMMHRLDVGLSSSYITKVERVVDLPVGVMFLKPTIEYGSRWGGLIEDFYVSLDCKDTRREIYIELGANCLRLGPFYRANIGELEFTGSFGFMRIDLAALATGEFGGFEYAGQIDEERNGEFVGVKLRHTISNILWLSPSCCFAEIKNGSFWEYGGVLAFMPFKNREVPDFLKELAFTTGISIAQLGYTTQEGGSYTLTFGYYLVGVSYEMGTLGKPKVEEQKIEEQEIEKPETEKLEPEEKEKHEEE